ncbi:glycosyltransferase family 2 protein [Mesorhizobium sp. CAU 1741]|uniref:glycosyltransferase family 2 protein n=1 Tax=Mesorhizobium sp. CAU 1741 TaxID=3140366 RepID=UPI00325B2E19
MQDVSSTLPHVSVIVPAYNAAWCLERTLISIAAQTYPNFDVIIVNDGSTDGTEAVIDAFIAGDVRFRKLCQSNKGVVEARNSALLKTDGEFVAPIDSDDLWAPDYLCEQVKALQAAPPEVPFSFCYSLWIDEQDRLLSASVPDKPPRTDLIGILRENSVGNGSAAVFRRSALEAVGGYDATLMPRGARGGEDWKLSLMLTAVHSAVLVPKPLVAYRITAGSLSADANAQAKSLLIVLDDVKKAYPQISAHNMSVARTDFLVWLLPRWARAGNWPAFVRHAFIAYVLNPRAILNGKHRAALKALVRELLSGSPPPLAPVDGRTFQEFVSSTVPVSSGNDR